MTFVLFLKIFLREFTAQNTLKKTTTGNGEKSQTATGLAKMKIVKINLIKYTIFVKIFTKKY